MKTYKLETQQVEIKDENKRYEVSETKSVTNKNIVSYSELERRHTSSLEQIERLKIEADKILTEMEELKTKNSLVISTDLPARFNV